MAGFERMLSDNLCELDSAGKECFLARNNKYLLILWGDFNIWVFLQNCSVEYIFIPGMMIRHNDRF